MLGRILNDSILDDITIEAATAGLIGKLRENKAKYVKEHAAAMDEWRKLVKAELEEKVKKLESGDLEQNDLSFEAIRPIDRSAQYDKMIGFFEASVEPILKLTKQQYDCIVNDQWDWRQDAARISASNRGTMSRYR